MRKFYIYKTTNLINKKIYIGYHTSYNIENDNYLGSGKILWKAINKYGMDNFKREILYELNTFEEMLEMESKLVNKDFIKRDDTYNLALGGLGWQLGQDPHNKNKVCIHSPLTHKNYYIDSDDLQEFISDGWKNGSNTKNNRNCIEKNHNIKYVSNDELNNFISDGWCLSNTTMGKICLTNIKTKKLKYVDPNKIDDFLKIGYEMGNVHSGVNKNTIYIKKNKKNKRIDPKKLFNYLKDGWVEGKYQKNDPIRRMYNPKTDELKNIKIDECEKFEKNGWKFGVNYKSANQYSIYITKDKKNKRINPAELDKFIDVGWKRGMYNKKYN